MRQCRDQAHQGQPQLTSVDHPNQLSTTFGSTDVILLSILFPDHRKFQNILQIFRVAIFPELFFDLFTYMKTDANQQNTLQLARIEPKSEVRNEWHCHSLDKSNLFGNTFGNTLYVSASSPWPSIVLDDLKTDLPHLDGIRGTVILVPSNSASRFQQDWCAKFADVWSKTIRLGKCGNSVFLQLNAFWSTYLLSSCTWV